VEIVLYWTTCDNADGDGGDDDADADGGEG